VGVGSSPHLVLVTEVFFPSSLVLWSTTHSITLFVLIVPGEKSSRNAKNRCTSAAHANVFRSLAIIRSFSTGTVRVQSVIPSTTGPNGGVVTSSTNEVEEVVDILSTTSISAISASTISPSPSSTSSSSSRLMDDTKWSDHLPSFSSKQQLIRSAHDSTSNIGGGVATPTPRRGRGGHGSNSNNGNNGRGRGTTPHRRRTGHGRGRSPSLSASPSPSSPYIAPTYYYQPPIMPYPIDGAPPVTATMYAMPPSQHQQQYYHYVPAASYDGLPPSTPMDASSPALVLPMPSPSSTSST
jgi:hypothetical protein